jgi:hypothetical protein
MDEEKKKISREQAGQPVGKRGIVRQPEKP